MLSTKNKILVFLSILIAGMTYSTSFAATSASANSAATASEKALMNQYVPKIISATNSGSFDEALKIYEELLSKSKNTSYFVGWDAKFSSWVLSDLVKVKAKLDDPTITGSGEISKVFLEAWNIEHRLAVELYFLGAKKYQLAFIYHELKACYFYDKSIEFENSAEAHKQKWITIFDIGIKDVTPAYDELSIALELNDKDIETYYRLGNVYFATNDYTGAISTYSSGLVIDSSYEKIYVNLWLSYILTKNTQKAYKTLNDGLSVCKDYCNFLEYHLWRLYYIDKDYENALIHLDKAINYAKKKGEVYRNAYYVKSSTLYELKRYSEAVKSAKWSINSVKDPMVKDGQDNQNTFWDDYSYIVIISAFAQLKDEKNALIFLKRAAALYPKSKPIQELYKLVK